MRIKEDKGLITFYVKERGGIVQELVMLGMGADELAVMSLRGNMSLETLLEMGKFLRSKA